MASTNELKQAVAKAALMAIPANTIIGLGTGSTVNYFIDRLALEPTRVKGIVPSSQATEQRLRQHHLPVVDVNDGPIDIYIDSADECNNHCQLIKGGGGALTREKILAAIAKTFICMIDESKKVVQLGEFPVAIEVIPLARSYVARELVKLGGDPVYRQGFVTDNGNQILDVYNLKILEPIALETQINHISGVVCNGIFANRGADKVLIANAQGITVLLPA